MESRSGCRTPSLWRWLLRARVIHPFPTAINALATLVLGVIATLPSIEWSIVLRMVVVMTLIQSAIGAVNDVRDLDLDTAGKRWKPLVVGVLTSRSVLAVAALAILLAVGVGATLGAQSLLLAMVGLCMGLSYDLWLKRSSLSALPYAIGIPLLPIWVWVTTGSAEGSVYWLLPLGALAGLALHLANALADFDGDALGGVTGLAQMLGRRNAEWAVWSCMAGALIVAVGVGRLALRDPERVLLGVVLAVVLVVTAALAVTLRRSANAWRTAFALLALASVICGGAWLSAM